MTLKYELFGKEDGNFICHLPNPTPTFFESIKRIRRQIPEIQSIFSPRSAFTNELARLSEGTRKIMPPHPINYSGLEAMTVYKSQKAADGMVVESKGQAIAVFTADCPTTTVYEGVNGRLAVLHCGFRSLVREDQDEMNIIESVFYLPEFEPEQVEVFVGFGIGPCCYGAAHWPEVQRGTIIARNGREMTLPLSRAIRGPRKGQTSLDLYALIRSELIKCGVPSNQIVVDRTCTACAGRSEGKGRYYSRVWEGVGQGANAAVAWFV